jgi:hypothetical protein
MTTTTNADETLGAARVALALHRSNRTTEGEEGDEIELGALRDLADAFEALDDLLAHHGALPAGWGAGFSPAAGASVLAYGSPFDGIVLVGPVEPNDAELEEFTDQHLRGQDWWYVDLTSLAEARGQAGLDRPQTGDVVDVVEPVADTSALAAAAEGRSGQ